MEKQQWRLLYRPEETLFDTTALPTAIMDGIREEGAPPTVIISGYKEYGLSIGYFQDIDTEVDAEACKQYGVRLMRRAGVGGGTIFCDPRVSMTAQIVFKTGFFPSMEKGFCQYGGALSQAYWRLGATRAWYDHIGDVRVGVKKITGFGPTVREDTMFYQAILSLGVPNFDIMMSIVRIPEEKFKDKMVKDAREWIGSIEAETGRLPSKGEVNDAFSKAIASVLDINLVEGELSSLERGKYEKYCATIASDEHHYFRSSGKRFAEIPEGCKLGLAKYKARKLIVSHVLVDEQKKIRDVQLSGDFYCGPTEYLTDMEKSLAGVNARDKEALLSKVKETYAKPNWEIPMVDAEDFVTAIGEAAEKI